MTEHTSGPWNVNGSAIEADDVTIAHVYDPDENGPDEYAANASLMAAAPELLSACEAAEVCFKHWELSPAEQAAVEQLRAAIKKATGQS